MIQLEIGDKEYEVPSSWEEVTLEYYCGVWVILDKYRYIIEPKEDEEVDADLIQRTTFKMYGEVFKYMTGIDDETLKKVPIEQVANLIEGIQELMDRYEPKGIDSFELEGEKYWFPFEFMRESTYGDYIEASQLELNTKYLENGRFDVLPEQMAILCRKDLEEFDEDEIEEKTKRFKKLTMDIVWEFAFFLNKRNSVLMQGFLTLKAEEETLKQQEQVEY